MTGYAKGGHIPGPHTAGPGLKLTPGEYIFQHDGRIYQVTNDGEHVTLIAERTPKNRIVSDYITSRYGKNRNRRWWGIAHRRWLLDSGRYVRSGEQRSARAGMPAGLRVIGEAGPELVNFRGMERRIIRARGLRDGDEDGRAE